MVYCWGFGVFAFSAMEEDKYIQDGLRIVSIKQLVENECL